MEKTDTMKYDLFRFKANGDVIPVGRFGTRYQAEQRRDMLQQQNPTGEYVIYTNQE